MQPRSGHNHQRAAICGQYRPLSATGPRMTRVFHVFLGAKALVPNPEGLRQGDNVYQLLTRWTLAAVPTRTEPEER